MVCNGKLAGVVSAGEGCGYPKLPGIYADLRVYLNWIEKYVDFNTTFPNQHNRQRITAFNNSIKLNFSIHIIFIIYFIKFLVCKYMLM